MLRMAIIQVKEHESKQYYALWFIAGLLYNFTPIKIKGPNKTFRMKNSSNNYFDVSASFRLFYQELC